MTLKSRGYAMSLLFNIVVAVALLLLQGMCLSQVFISIQL